MPQKTPVIIKQKFNTLIFNPLKARVNNTLPYFLSVPDYVFYILIFLSYIFLQFCTFNINPDVSMQLHSLINFVNGHGISLSDIDKNNLIVYKPLGLWPAGLVVFMTPIYIITKSAITSSLVVKIAADIFIILFLGKYLRLLAVENYRRKIILLFFAVSVSPLIYFGPSDTLATALCLWGFYHNIKYQQTSKKNNLFIALLLLSLSYFVKFSFFPFIFYPFAAFILKEGRQVFKQWKQAAFILLFSVVALVCFYFLNVLLTGKTVVASSFDAFQGHAHWNQFEKMDGFLFTFGNYEWLYENYIRNHLGIDMLFNWISILITVLFYCLFLMLFLNKKSNAISTAFSNSINISLSAGALIVFFLSFLTVNNPGQTWMKPYWTFVEESRYYAPVIIIGLINILIITMRKHSIAGYAIIAAFFCLNMFAYDFAAFNGFWGVNAKTYFTIRKNVSAIVNLDPAAKKPLVFYDRPTNRTHEYYYLESQAAILVDKTRYKPHQDYQQLFNCYFLNQDSSGVVTVTRCN